MVGSSQQGFTLVEIILVILILGILAGVLLPPLVVGTQEWTHLQGRKALVEEGQQALLRMDREIRNLARKADGSPCIGQATPIRFSFSRVGGNTTLCQDITFSWNNNRLYRNGLLLVEGVSQFAFTYYDGNNQVTTNPTQIRRVEMVLTLSRNGETLTLRDTVTPLNLVEQDG